MSQHTSLNLPMNHRGRWFVKDFRNPLRTTFLTFLAFLTNFWFFLCGSAQGQAPEVTTGSATAITYDSATLGGTVNPHGLASTAQIEYGLTNEYGSTISVVLAPDNGVAAQTVSANLSGLQPATIYHYRLTAANSEGPGIGSDATFTTETLPFIYDSNGVTVAITGYTGAGGAVTIPATIEGLPVTRIDDFVFADWDNLTSVAIPVGVTSVGDYAFAGCSGLTDLTIPSGLTSLGIYAFSGCSGLESVTLPGSLVGAGNFAFYNCTKLKSITLPASLASIGTNLFSGCSSLASVVIPVGVTSIGPNMFSSCTGLTSVTIPAGVTSIGISAFTDCSGLASVVIPASVTTIGAYAFSGCGGLTSVMIPASVTAIGTGMFFDCARLTRVTIPAGVTSIGNGAFYGCRGLEHVTIPVGVTNLGDSAFYGCSNLTSACFLGNAPTTMGAEVFDETAGSFTVYYFNGKAGFTSPQWKGHAAINMGEPTPFPPWLLANGFGYDADIGSDPNNDGVNLLMAYALDLDPQLNLSGAMPVAVVAGSELRLGFYAGSAGVTYAVETSTDMLTWTTAGVTLSDLDAYQMRTASVNRVDPARFMRLGVGIAP